jgi:hypothetical protein
MVKCVGVNALMANTGCKLSSQIHTECIDVVSAVFLGETFRLGDSLDIRSFTSSTLSSFFDCLARGKVIRLIRELDPNYLYTKWVLN